MIESDWLPQCHRHHWLAVVSGAWSEWPGSQATDRIGSRGPAAALSAQASPLKSVVHSLSSRKQSSKGAVSVAVKIPAGNRPTDGRHTPRGAGGHRGSTKGGKSPRAAAVSPEEAKGAGDLLESGESYTLEEGSLDRSHCPKWGSVSMGRKGVLDLSPPLLSSPAQIPTEWI